MNGFNPRERPRLRVEPRDGEQHAEADTLEPLTEPAIRETEGREAIDPHEVRADRGDDDHERAVLAKDEVRRDRGHAEQRDRRSAREIDRRELPLCDDARAAGVTVVRRVVGVAHEVRDVVRVDDEELVHEAEQVHGREELPAERAVRRERQGLPVDERDRDADLREWP